MISESKEHQFVYKVGKYLSNSNIIDTIYKLSHI